MELIGEEICIMVITKEMLSELGLNSETDTSDIINIGMQVDSVETTALIKEADNGVKVSLRSKSKVDVRKVAEGFGGGGHIRASGLRLENKTVNEAKELIVNELKIWFK